MTDIEAQVDGQPSSNSAFNHHQSAGLQEVMSGERESLCTESLHREVKDALLMLADVAMPPPCGDCVSCSYDCEHCSFVDIGQLEMILQSMQLQLQFLLSKADTLQDSLGQGDQDVFGQVSRLLHTCQPFFNQVEAISRSTVYPRTPAPFEFYTMCVQLLDFSQQLCDRLEQLLLTCASFDRVCLDEGGPNSVSHFCVGQSQHDGLRLTAFYYCKPTPYLSCIDIGLYKRMRWNVERLRDDAQQAQQQHEEQDGEGKERELETVGDIEYYFLCCEDFPNSEANSAEESSGAPDGDVARVWSIGRWVQVSPSPDSEDIYDWILCQVPVASYQRFLCLGSDEPSISIATNHLLKLLLPCQKSVLE